MRVIAKFIAGYEHGCPVLIDLIDVAVMENVTSIESGSILVVLTKITLENNMCSVANYWNPMTEEFKKVRLEC